MIEEKILSIIGKHSLLQNVSHITVALSGGADSMCLLYALFSLKEKLGVSISAAHLNHCIRGDEAKRDEDFVRGVCNRLGIQLVCEQIDVPKFAAEEKISLELAARKVRYDFFSRVSKGVVATAHNANDNLETLIFNLTRGTSLKGLCSIPVKRDNFIRPLLYCTRDEIEKYCSENKIEFVTDSTNLSDEYTRNRIRHNIIPLLKEINPAVEYNTVKMCENLKEDYSVISSLADEYIAENATNSSLCTENFSDLSASVAKSVLGKFVSMVNIDIDLSSMHFEKLLDIALNGGKVSLPNDYSAVCNDNILSVKSNKQKTHVEFSVNIVKKANNFKENKNVNNLFLNNTIDCDKICGKLEVRTRLPGDKMRPAKRGITKTLKQLFTEQKIPLEERANLPVLADENGIVYVHGIGAAERCAVNEKTNNFYIVDVKKIGEL